MIDKKGRSCKKKSKWIMLVIKRMYNNKPESSIKAIYFTYFWYDNRTLLAKRRQRK